MALPWWQHHKHCLGYYYYYYRPSYILMILHCFCQLPVMWFEILVLWQDLSQTNKNGRGLGLRNLVLFTSLPTANDATIYLSSFGETVAPFYLKISWAKIKLQNLSSGPAPATIPFDGSIVDSVDSFVYLSSLQSPSAYCSPELRRFTSLDCLMMLVETTRWRLYFSWQINSAVVVVVAAAAVCDGFSVLWNSQYRDRSIHSVNGKINVCLSSSRSVSTSHSCCLCCCTQQKRGYQSLT